MVSPGPGNPPGDRGGLGGEDEQRRAPVASQRGRRATWASTATATNAAPVAAPATAPLAAQASAEPGSRRAAS